MAKEVGMEFAFFEFLHSFYKESKGRIRNNYKAVTKKYLDYNDKEPDKEDPRIKELQDQVGELKNLIKQAGNMVPP